MRISKFKLKNYVSFFDEDAEDVELGPSINFIVGKNNSGKTALIRALSRYSSGKDPRERAHRSPATVPEKTLRDSADRKTRYEIEYTFLSNEILKYFLGRETMYLVAPGRLSESSGRQYIERFLACGLQLRCQYEGDVLQSVEHERLRSETGDRLNDHVTIFKCTVSDDLQLSQNMDV